MKKAFLFLCAMLCISASAAPDLGGYTVSTKKSSFLVKPIIISNIVSGDSSQWNLGLGHLYEPSNKLFTIMDLASEVKWVSVNKAHNCLVIVGEGKPIQKKIVINRIKLSSEHQQRLRKEQEEKREERQKEQEARRKEREVVRQFLEKYRKSQRIKPKPASRPKPAEPEEEAEPEPEPRYFFKLYLNDTPFPSITFYEDLNELLEELKGYDGVQEVKYIKPSRELLRILGGVERASFKVLMQAIDQYTKKYPFKPAIPESPE